MAKNYPGRAVGQVPHRHPDGAFRAATRTASTWSSPRTCSATSSPTSGRPAPARSASRRRATSIRSGNFPSLFEPVHGSAPDIAGQGHRQSDRSDLVRRHDARASRRGGGRARRSCGRSSACWRTTRLRTRDLGGKAGTNDLRQGRRGGAGLKPSGARQPAGISALLRLERIDRAAWISDEHAVPCSPSCRSSGSTFCSRATTRS